MLLVYTISYFVSTMFYFTGHRIIASIIMMLLAIFLYFAEIRAHHRIINVRGLFAIGFIGGFGLSLLKLSKLSGEYSVLMFLVVFSSYFSIYLGAFVRSRKKNVYSSKIYLTKVRENKLTSQEVLLILMILVTFISFVIEVAILKFVPLFTINTPHAYSTFHIFGLHYITTFYSFIPCFALCNFYTEPHKGRSKAFVIISFIYVIIMALLMVSRYQLILSLVLSLFIYVIYNNDEFKKKVLVRKRIVYAVALVLFFALLYMLITISRAHDVEYLNGIFEMKNEHMPIFITQPYMYIAHNFENLNYMINNIFRWTFGRRVLYPFFTLTFIKKFFPIVVDSPYYIIKTELSTVTLVYDFYYDFGIVGVIVFCFLIGYIGKMIEDKAYDTLASNATYKNNYIMVFFALFCYFMLFSFFQTYFSLTDTWIYIIILSLLISTFTMTKNFQARKGEWRENEKKNESEY